MGLHFWDGASNRDKEGAMKRMAYFTFAVALVALVCDGLAAAEPAGEYAKHFEALSQLSIAVAQAMPAEHYAFRPHPESMTVGEKMTHIAVTNYQLCAGLQDSAARECPKQRKKKVS